MVQARRSRGSWLLGVLALTAATGLSLPQGTAAQQPTDSLRAEVQRLAVLVDSLAREVARLRAEGREPEADQAEDALARLRAAAEAAAGDTPEPNAEPQEFVGRQRSLQSLNPEISVTGDLFAHIDPNDPDADNFFWREFELSFVSALDPFSRAAIFISRHGDGPEIAAFGEGHHGEDAGGVDEAAGEDAHDAGGFDIEEGYVEWVSLPGGVGLKFGKFFQRLGTLNRWHSHALPFQSRSLTHIALIGEEALAQTGLSVSWLAPFGGGSAGTYEATFEVTRSENEQLFGDAHSASVLSHVNGFWQLGSSVDLELGVSWVYGHYKYDGMSFPRSVYNVEAALNWVEPSQTRQSGLMVRGGYMLLDGLVEEVSGMDGAGTAGGFWSLAEMRLSPSWLVGARFDRTANPDEPEVSQWLFSPTLTWWQSEFVRVRGEYDVLGAFEDQDRRGMFFLQVTIAMGPHKHATY